MAHDRRFVTEVTVTCPATTRIPRRPLRRRRDRPARRARDRRPAARAGARSALRQRPVARRLRRDIRGRSTTALRAREAQAFTADHRRPRRPRPRRLCAGRVGELARRRGQRAAERLDARVRHPPPAPSPAHRRRRQEPGSPTADIVFPASRATSAASARPPAAAPRLLARDGTPLARGRGRASQAPVATAIPAGSTAAARAARAAARADIPEDATVGASGPRAGLRPPPHGPPRRRLLAGGRALAGSARVRGRGAHDDRPGVQACRRRRARRHYGGAPSRVRAPARSSALAGVAFSALQPPGLDVQDARPGSARGAPRGAAARRSPGRERRRRSRASSSRTRTASTAAARCASLRALLQLGLRTARGAPRRPAARRDRRLRLQPGPRSPAPPPARSRPRPTATTLAVGSWAIGQGRVQATTLKMSRVAAAIGRRGRPARRPCAWARRRSSACSRAGVPRACRPLHAGRGQRGHGPPRAIVRRAVAGKTGTAELRAPRARLEADPRTCPPIKPTTRPTPRPGSPPMRPAGGRGVAVGAVLVRPGAGGEAAAPDERQVLVAGLQRRGEAPGLEVESTSPLLRRRATYDPRAPPGGC